MTRHPRRLVTVLASATAALAVVAALASPANADTAKIPAAGSKYVAVGESGAAGPLLPGTPTGPPACLQTSINYPHLLADQLNLNLDDVSCSGATTQDAYTPQTKGADGAQVPIAPPQLDAVTKNTKLVTFDFGSNNVQTTQLFIQCINAFRTTSSCQSAFTQNGQDVYAQRIAKNAPLIGKLIRDIRAKAAPGVQIVVVSRLQKIKDGGCPAQVPIKAQDATYINSVTKALNAMLEQQAKANGATYLDMYTPSSKNHDICAGADKWTEGYVPTTPDAPLHTNKVGHEQIEKNLIAALRN